MVSTTLESSLGGSEEPPRPSGPDSAGGDTDQRPDDKAARRGLGGPAAGGLWDLGRWSALAAVAMVGAGIVHFAYAPMHLDEELSHGLFFLVTGWLQLVLAVALVTRIRPRQLWLGATALVNLGVIGTWVVSRTVGVPGSEAEAVGFPDVTSTVLEAVAVLVACAILAGVLADRALRGSASSPSTTGATGKAGRGSSGVGLVGVGAIATIAVVSMAVSPSFAGDHSHGGEGEGAGHGHDGEAAADGHGHDGDAAAMDPEQWAQTRYDALAGYATPEQVEQFKAVEADYLATQIRNRSDLLRTLPPDEAEARITAYTDWAVENTIDLLDGAQTNGEGMHSHGATTWQPIADSDGQLELQQQLEEAGTVVAQFPDVEAAEAGGYYQISPYVPGIGAHWINGGLLDGDFEPGKPEMLLFNGTEKDSELVGLSYAALSDEPPEGFVGPNDTWHAHPALCMLGGLVVGIDGTPQELCESIGGGIASGLDNLQMAHYWPVPGWQSEWGLFSAENPNLNVTTSDIGRDILAGG
jgi:hypothetical protein